MNSKKLLKVSLDTLKE